MKPAKVRLNRGVAGRPQLDILCSKNEHFNNYHQS